MIQRMHGISCFWDHERYVVRAIYSLSSTNTYKIDGKQLFDGSHWNSRYFCRLRFLFLWPWLDTMKSYWREITAIFILQVCRTFYTDQDRQISCWTLAFTRMILVWSGSAKKILSPPNGHRWVWEAREPICVPIMFIRVLMFSCTN